MDSFMNLSPLNTTVSRKVISLQFGSGSRFPNFAGKLQFNHDSVSIEKRITGNTCALSITIPVNKRYTCNSNEFAQKLMEDIFEAYGFGLP